MYGLRHTLRGLECTICLLEVVRYGTCFSSVCTPGIVSPLDFYVLRYQESYMEMKWQAMGDTCDVYIYSVLIHSPWFPGIPHAKYFKDTIMKYFRKATVAH